MTMERFANYVFTCYIIAETDKSFKVQTPARTCWIPKSCIVGCNKKNDGTYEIFIPQWLAFERKLTTKAEMRKSMNDYKIAFERWDARNGEQMKKGI